MVRSASRQRHTQRGQARLTATFSIPRSAPGIYDRGFTNNAAYANLPGPYAYSVTMQAAWEQCVMKYGCVASGNPFTQFRVYFDGTYHIVQRQ
jgi:hypothetical protein